MAKAGSESAAEALSGQEVAREYGRTEIGARRDSGLVLGFVVIHVLARALYGERERPLHAWYGRCV